MAESEWIEVFKVAAEGYVEFLESVEARSQDEFLVGVSRTLSVLYRAGLDLPDVWDDNWQFNGEHRPRERTQQRLLAHIRQLMGDEDSYVSVVAYGPHAGKDLGGSLSDDLIDIYAEVSTGLSVLREGGSPGEAAWVWRFGFWGHWGEHAVDALRIVYSHIAEDIGGTTAIAGGGH